MCMPFWNCELKVCMFNMFKLNFECLGHRTPVNFNPEYVTSVIQVNYMRSALAFFEYLKEEENGLPAQNGKRLILIVAYYMLVNASLMLDKHYYKQVLILKGKRGREKA